LETPRKLQEPRKPENLRGCLGHAQRSIVAPT
jgi:hypothetical protein